MSKSWRIEFRAERPFTTSMLRPRTCITLAMAATWLSTSVDAFARGGRDEDDPPVIQAPLTSDAPPASDPPPTASSPPSSQFDSLAQEVSLNVKLYGDSAFSVRNHASKGFDLGSTIYAPNVWSSFAAPHLDLFATAEVGRLAFLSEIMFEADDNAVAVDVERMQIAYLVANPLRLRIGRSHTAFGYYNDTYHHGNLFELTTDRPFSFQFEDRQGFIPAHIVGAAVDGTFDLGRGGRIRYDAEIGNGRMSDIHRIAIQFAAKNDKLTNLRLRWMTPIDGLLVGANFVRDVVPSLDAIGTAAGRPEAEELIGGVHVVYNEHSWLVDAEAFAVRHNPTGAPSSQIYAGFVEVGRSFGAFTPYVRGEYIRLPSTPDSVFQYSADSAQGVLAGDGSQYANVREMVDARVGVKWMPVSQLALRIEGERVSRDGNHQESATFKVAFGF